MMYLRQSTASQSVLIGPFVDSTDGVTPETDLTINNTDIRLSANGGNIAAKNTGGGVHDELGYYTITLNATDTATVGRLPVACNMAGALPVYHEFMVLEEAIFDGLFAASAARIPADVTAISGDTVAADNLESYCDGTTPQPVNVTQFGGSNGTFASGVPAVNATQINSNATAAARQAIAASAMVFATVDNTGFSPTTSAFETSTITEATSSHFVGRIVIFTSGVLQFQQALITAYSLQGGRGRFTVTTMTDAPANGDGFIVV